MGFAKQMKKQKEVKVIGMARTTPITESEWNEALAAEQERLIVEANTPNTLWGPATAYATQAEYQRACLGSKFNY